MEKVKAHNTKTRKVKRTSVNKGALSKKDMNSGLYKAIVNSALEGFWIINLDGDILDANDAICQMIGYSRDELLSMNIKEIDVDFIESPGTLPQKMAKAKGAGGALFEARHKRKDGSIIDVQVSLKYLDTGKELLFCFHRDITLEKEQKDYRDSLEKLIKERAEALEQELKSHKRTEEALKVSEERHRSLFQNVPVALYELDYTEVEHRLEELRAQGIKDFRTYFSSNVEALFEYSSHTKFKTINKAAIELFEAENENHYYREFTSLNRNKVSYYDSLLKILINIAENNYNFEYEEYVKTLKGNWQHHMVKFSPAPGQGKTPSRMLVSIFDVTKLKNLESDLQKSYEAEIFLRKKLEYEIEQRIEFTRALVHEMKTPLTPLLGASDLLCNNLKEEPWLTLARQVYKGATDIDQRIDELFTLTKSEVGKLILNRTTIDPSVLLKDAVDYMMSQATKTNHKLVIDITKTLPQIYCDPQSINQVLLNLIDNALKFTPEGTLITFKAQQKDSFLAFQVIDTGPGISPDRMKYIFMPYVHLDDEMEHLSGLGLGLALCKNLVKLNGGDITVESKPGNGCCFTFTIPIAGKDKKTDKKAGQR